MIRLLQLKALGLQRWQVLVFTSGLYVHAGAFAGTSVNLLVFPIDTLKTRLQSPSFQQTYRSATAVADRTLWRGLYQGIGTIMLVTVPSSGVFFTSYEGLKYMLGDSQSSSDAHGFLPQPAVHALSSSIAQLINCAVVAPFEVIKQNAQMLAVTHSAAVAPSLQARSPTMLILRQLKRHPASMWRGYTALAARDLPFTALQFPVFEYLKGILIARRTRLNPAGEPITSVLERAWISAVSAGVAGSAAAWVTTPFDVVKTRMMLEAGTPVSYRAQCGSSLRLVNGDGRERGQARRRNGYQVGKEVVRKEGVRGLFRGGAIRAVFTIFGNGLFMGCYEGAKFYLQDGEKADRGSKL